MDDVDELVEVFAGEQRRLQALAYRMSGSWADAEEVVQDSWLRWQRLDPASRAEIERPAAWLTTTVSRLALDRLRSAQHQREVYVGPWLPEPVLAAPDPAESVELAETLTLGFLTMLERLGPVERAVFLLADVFGQTFAEVAEIVGRSEEACRQIAHRARQRVREDRPRFAPSSSDQLRLVEAFLAACGAGNVGALADLLEDDVVLVSDGGAARHAARVPVVGVRRVTTFVINVSRRLLAEGGAALRHDVRMVNGEPGLVVWNDGVAALAMAFEVRDERIAAVRVVLNPDKLGAVRAPH